MTTRAVPNLLPRPSPQRSSCEVVLRPTHILRTVPPRVACQLDLLTYPASPQFAPPYLPMRLVPVWPSSYMSPGRLIAGSSTRLGPAVHAHVSNLCRIGFVIALKSVLVFASSCRSCPLVSLFSHSLSCGKYFFWNAQCPFPCVISSMSSPNPL